MKRITALILAVLMCAAAFSGCSKKTDWEYIKSKGTMTIGITLFEPMNYKDSSGKLTGFETEFAEAVCAKLGVKAKFQEIEWSAKETELNSKNIDCIWNGLTIDDERSANMDISIPYLMNKQVMVVKAENLSKYSMAANIAGATVVAEKESAGEKVALSQEVFKKANFTPVDSQAKVLMEVSSGTTNIGIIDYVMSIGAIGKGTDYAGLSVVTSAEFAEEQYGIAFRKGSPETLKKVNDAIKQLASDGTLAKIAEKYKLKDLLLVK